MNRILVIEPYFGGSHRQFLLGLQQNIDAEFVFLTLSARKWKMKMQLSAPWFADCVSKMENQKFDTVLCSTFVDVAVLQALLNRLKGWNEKCLYCTYYHENQFAYPTRLEDKTIYQFTSINYNTALVSDRLAFNSQYNLHTFLAGCRRYLKKCTDFDLRHTTEQIEEKSSVLYPGINFDQTPGLTKDTSDVPVICWNHRWEHDKNPEQFFSSLEELDKKGYPFKLVILGQSFRDEPPIFHWAQKRFAAQLLQFGYVSCREEYVSWLKKSDIVVSTALHEFFGISVMEAVGAGCIPLVPDRLSYPELYPSYFRYQDGELSRKLGDILTGFMKDNLPSVDIDLSRFGWNALKQSYSKWLL